MTKTQSKKPAPKLALSSRPVTKKRSGNFTSSVVITPTSPRSSPKIPIPVQKRLLQGNLHLLSDKMYANLKIDIKEEIAKYTNKVMGKTSRLLERKWELLIKMIVLRIKALQKTIKSSISALMEGLATKKATRGSVSRKIAAANKNFSEQHDVVKVWAFEQLSSFLQHNNISS